MYPPVVCKTPFKIDQKSNFLKKLKHDRKGKAFQNSSDFIPWAFQCFHLCRARIVDPLHQPTPHHK